MNLSAYIQVRTDSRAQLNVANIFDQYTNYCVMPGGPLKATLSLNFDF